MFARLVKVVAIILLGISTVGSASRLSAWQEVNGGAESRLTPGDVELKASRVFTFVDKTGLGHQHGIEGWLKSSSLQLNAKENAGRLVFDMNSFDADTAQARRFLGLEGETSESTRQQVNQNMKGRDILDTVHYPESVFVVSSSLPTGKVDSKHRPEYKLVGEFTLHGVTKPLQVLCYLEKSQGWVRVLGQFEVKQTDYGIRPYTKAFGAIGVADKLRVHGAIWLAPSEGLDLGSVPELK
jgi:polyisoprenoid-binding protein YceI